MKVFNVHEAKAKLSELLDRAAAGEEVVIARRGRPIARLAVLEAARPQPVPGRLKGRILLADDFDAPLADFEPYT